MIMIDDDHRTYTREELSSLQAALAHQERERQRSTRFLVSIILAFNVIAWCVVVWSLLTFIDGSGLIDG